MVGAGRFETGEIPAGEVAVAIHAGPYAELGETHRAVADWIREQGRAASGPC